MKSRSSKDMPILSPGSARTMRPENPSCWQCSKAARRSRGSMSSRPSPSGCKRRSKKCAPNLYEGFINAVEEGLPPAKIVADRFHIAKLYRAAVDAWRKIEMKELKAILTKEEYARLKGVLGALQKRHENLEPEEQALLDGLFEASPSLPKAYNLREKLTRLFDK